MVDFTSHPSQTELIDKSHKTKIKWNEKPVFKKAGWNIQHKKGKRYWKQRESTIKFQQYVLKATDHKTQLVFITDSPALNVK